MKTINLNSDVLNDVNSIYFQKNVFELIGIQREPKEGITKFLHRAKHEIRDNGHTPNVVFMSIVLYSEIQEYMNKNDISKDLMMTVDSYILDILNISSDFMVYIPNFLKDQCRTV
ncbi:MAG: hypothetical protein QM653_15805 [Dysgonomonas sp.]|uniref:hypothetical protein n=1 Tax=Dysgonomonas sp. TaxID=1891233 RepID=UPI0039E2E3BE